MKGTIKSRRQFREVYDHGRRAFGPHVVVFALTPASTSSPRSAPQQASGVGPDEGADAVRVGIVASRKVGGAVRRSRAKRVLRAAWRPLLSYLPAGSRVVLVARRSLVDENVRSTALRDELAGLLARIGLLEESPT